MSRKKKDIYIYIYIYIYDKNIGFRLEGIWTTNLDYITFYWIWTGKSFGRQFIIKLIRYFTGTGLGNTWTMNLD